MTVSRFAALVLFLCSYAATSARAADDSQALAFFESKIRPVLARHCYQCHSTETGKSEGGLLLDSREKARAGGDRGPAVVPGKPEASLLLTAISHSDIDLKMPPKQERLPQIVINDMTAWIRMGAPDPRDAPPKIVRTSVDVKSGRDFWAFQKAWNSDLPAMSNPSWVLCDLDHFILAKLDAAGLAPAADADPATLLRRLYFDLVGLPPSPAELEAFTQQTRPTSAYEAVVDELLASQRFGERWGRHWLDLARYAESSGKESNVSFPYAWRYRDYIIDALNADKPFDRFLVEQIAGDLLPYSTPAERADLLIATGFLALGPKNLSETNHEQFLADVADEQIDTLTRAILANSVACARCHDHKFDPFSTEDYYALSGIFLSSKTWYGTHITPENQVGGDPLVLPPITGQLILNKPLPAAQVAKLKAERAAMQKERDDKMAAVQLALQRGEDPSNIFTLEDALRILWRTGGITGQLNTVSDTGQALPLAMGVTDRDKMIDAPLVERGELAKPGPIVPRGFPRVIELAIASHIPANHSGRLELAQWLTHPDHPLTARVMANRVWQHLLGAGIVRTVDNFGTTGERPSHPELLDHLATRFVAGGWSLKKLIREIVLSRTYRQASTYSAAAFQKDPDNRLLWRANKRRLQAEAIRDAMLFASGQLDTARPAGSLIGQLGDRPISIIGLDKRVPADLDGARHRSVYLPILRDRLPDVLDLFDFAEPSLVTGARDTTNVPLQALYLMNSPFVQAQARALAVRLMKSTSSEDEQIRQAFLHCYCRAPDATERQLAAEFLATARQYTETNEKSSEHVLASYCQALLAAAEFRNID